MFGRKAIAFSGLARSLKTPSWEKASRLTVRYGGDVADSRRLRPLERVLARVPLVAGQKILAKAVPLQVTRITASAKAFGNVSVVLRVATHAVISARSSDGKGGACVAVTSREGSQAVVRSAHGSGGRGRIKPAPFYRGGGSFSDYNVLKG